MAQQLSHKSLSSENQFGTDDIASWLRSSFVASASSGVAMGRKRSSGSCAGPGCGLGRAEVLPILPPALCRRTGARKLLICFAITPSNFMLLQVLMLLRGSLGRVQGGSRSPLAVRSCANPSRRFHSPASAWCRLGVEGNARLLGQPKSVSRT